MSALRVRLLVLNEPWVKVLIANIVQAGLCVQIAAGWTWGPTWMWIACAVLSLADAVSAWRNWRAG